MEDQDLFPENIYIRIMKVGGINTIIDIYQRLESDDHSSIKHVKHIGYFRLKELNPDSEDGREEILFNLPISNLIKKVQEKIS